MFIALRDIRFARGRFALMGTVIALVAVLMVMLSGLATGLVDDGVAGLRALPADHVAFSAGSDLSFSRSVVERDTWQTLAQVPGVRTATPLGNTLFNGHTTDGTAVDVALFGMPPDSVAVPTVVSGQPPGMTPDGVVVSRDLADQGVAVGDVLRLDRVPFDLPVVGISPTATFGHVPVVYAPLDTWQRASFGSAPDASQLATVVLLQTDGDPALAAADQRLGTETVTLQAAYAGSPGYSEETATMTMIRGFLYVISALLVGAFFVVWTIQRRHEIALVKALGGSNGYLLRDALGQVTLVLVAATAVGAGVGWGLGSMVGDAVPFALRAGPVVTASLVLVAVGIVGALVAVRRITTVDPLIALGGDR